MPLIASFTVSIVALIMAAYSSQISFDAYWHLATGRDFLNFGDSPFRDHFSFTYFGEEIKSNAIAFQVIIYKYTSILGFENGLILFKLTVYLFFLITVYLFYKANEIKNIAVVLTLPLITYFLIRRGLNIRPEVISYILLMLCLIMYFKSIKNFNSKNLMLISLLLIAWGNYHTPIIGYIVIAGLFLEKGIQKLLNRDDSFSWIFFSSWAIIIFLTGFINIKFDHFFFSQLGFSAEWKVFIAEYSPIYDYETTSFIIVFYSLGIILLAWLFKTQRYGMLFICILLLTQNFYVVRLISFTGIIIASLYSVFISEYIQTFNFSANTKPRSKTVNVLALTLVISTITGGHLYLLYKSYGYFHGKPNKETVFPVKTVNYLVDNYSSGNIFNRYSDGGYLDYHLPKNIKVYIDGRSNILFPLDFMKRHMRSMNYPSTLAAEVDKYDIDFAILKNHPFNYELIYNTERFTIDYVDKYFFLATTRAGNFPISGSILMKPACWDAEITPDLISEIEKGKQVLPSVSPLREILENLERYSQSSDKQLFFQQILSNTIDSNLTKRVLLYLALKQGFINDAISLLDSMNRKFSTDIMAVGISFIKQEDYTKAYKLLNSETIPVRFTKLTSSEQQTLLGILKIVLPKMETKIDKGALSDLENIKSIPLDSLQSELCNTRILPVIEDY